MSIFLLIKETCQLYTRFCNRTLSFTACCPYKMFVFQKSVAEVFIKICQKTLVI